MMQLAPHALGLFERVLGAYLADRVGVAGLGLAHNHTVLEGGHTRSGAFHPELHTLRLAAK